MSWKLEDLNLYTPVIKTSASFFAECLLELSVLSCAPLVVLELNHCLALSSSLERGTVEFSCVSVPDRWQHVIPH